MRLRLRGLFAAHPVVFFVLGVLFAGQLPGEPLHARMFLAVLLALAVVAGVVYEGTRPGGTIELHDRLAACRCTQDPECTS